MKIENHVFLVTGGGSGLGAATATMLAANGGKVVIADLNEAAGRDLEGFLGRSEALVRQPEGESGRVRGHLDDPPQGVDGGAAAMDSVSICLPY